MAQKSHSPFYLILFAAICCSLLLSSTNAHAQTLPEFSSVQVDLLPEYDRPSLLVIYRMVLAPDTDLPAQLTLVIPKNAEVWAVAEKDSSGTLINSLYTTQDVNQETQLIFTVNSLSFQVEYYTDIEKSGSTRQITYTWAGNYGAQSLSVDFLLPTGATDPIFSPEFPDNTIVDGLLHYQKTFVSLKAGESVTVEIEYQKGSDALTIGGNQANATSSNPIVQFWNDNQSVILLTQLGLVLLIGAVIGLNYALMNRKRPPTRKRHLQKNRTGTPSSTSVYCSQCGLLADPGDIYCRSCGTKLRKDS